MASNKTPQPQTSSSKKKLKYKKDALEHVDKELEFKNDNKYKTELCASYQETNFCQYGNKCRFAHGKEELFNKTASHPKYRVKDCISFHTAGYCNYGSRCHFRHTDNTYMNELNRSYYGYLLKMFPLKGNRKLVLNTRLPIFKGTLNNCSILARSNEFSPIKGINLLSLFNKCVKVRKWSDTNCSTPDDVILKPSEHKIQSNIDTLFSFQY